jgi:hypothetical protein
VWFRSFRVKLSRVEPSLLLSQGECERGFALNSALLGSYTTAGMLELGNGSWLELLMYAGRDFLTRCGLKALHGLWRVAALFVLMPLVVLRPLTQAVFGTLAVLGVLATFFFKLVGPPNFPFWTMLLLSFGCFVVLVIYEKVIRLLSE